MVKSVYFNAPRAATGLARLSSKARQIVVKQEATARHTEIRGHADGDRTQKIILHPRQNEGI